MPIYTLITEIRESFHVSQHEAATPQAAVANHIAALPYDDGAGPFDEELDWLATIGSGAGSVTLVDVCPAAWMWLEGARHNPPYSTYIVQTEIPR